MSDPPSPVRLSLPLPQFSESLPPPPVRLSLPPSPFSRSLPPPPFSASSPAPPDTESTRSPPLNVSFPDVPSDNSPVMKTPSSVTGMPCNPLSNPRMLNCENVKISGEKSPSTSPTTAPTLSKSKSCSPRTNLSPSRKKILSLSGKSASRYRSRSPSASRSATSTPAATSMFEIALLKSSAEKKAAVLSVNEPLAFCVSNWKSNPCNSVFDPTKRMSLRPSLLASNTSTSRIATPSAVRPVSDCQSGRSVPTAAPFTTLAIALPPIGSMPLLMPRMISSTPSLSISAPMTALNSFTSGSISMLSLSILPSLLTEIKCDDPPVNFAKKTSMRPSPSKSPTARSWVGPPS